MEKKLQEDWTVIYLIRVSEVYWKDAKRMLDDIAAQNLCGGVNVVVWLDAFLKFQHQLDPLESISPRGSITANMIYRLDGASWKRVKDVPLWNIKNRKDIRRYFNFVLDEYPAKKYLLFTWDHGTGYAIFNDGESPEETAGPFTLLNMKDLVKAIKKSFGKRDGQQINVVIMMNCYMQLFDTGYEFSRVGVEYLVSSENAGSFMGFNYKELFMQLFREHATMSSRGIAIQAVSLFNSETFLRELRPDDPLHHAAFFATDLRRYKSMYNNIDRLAKELINLPDAEIRNIGSRDFGLKYVNANRMIDFFFFIGKLRKMTGQNWNSDLFAEIEQLRAEIIVATFYGAEIKKEENKIPLGFSLGFAIEENDAGNILFQLFHKRDSADASTFTKENNWSHFTERYLALILVQRMSASSELMGLA